MRDFLRAVCVDQYIFRDPSDFVQQLLLGFFDLEEYLIAIKVVAVVVVFSVWKCLSLC